MNQSWCQSVQPFDSFPILECLPLNPPQVTPPCVSRGNLFGVSIPRWICRCVPNLVPIGQPFDKFSTRLLMPSSSCLCQIPNEMFNVSDIISTKMCSSAKKFCEYRHLADGMKCVVGPTRDKRDIILHDHVQKKSRPGTF